MPVDDMPEPEPAEPPISEADQQKIALDDAYQAGFNAGKDGHEWIKSALAVLGTEIEEGGGTLVGEAMRQARTEAARSIARIFRGVLPDDVDPEK